MMSKVASLLFALVALNAANVLAAPSHFVRDVQVKGSESGHSLTFSASIVPSGTASSAVAQKTKGHEHPRLWDDRYCHMPANHHHNGTEPHGHPHSSHLPGTSSVPATAKPSSLSAGAQTASATPSKSASADDGSASGSFDGNTFDMPDGGDLDASHNSSTATSSSSTDNDTLHISS